MTHRAAESRSEKCPHQFPGKRVTYDEAPEADHVQIIIFDALMCRESFMNQAGPDTRNFVRGNRCADTAPTDGHSAFQVSASYRLGERNDEIRVIIVLVPLPVTEFDHVVTGFAQLSGEMLHEFKSTMVSRDADALERFRESWHRRAFKAPAIPARPFAGGGIREQFWIAAVVHQTPLVSGIRLGVGALCPLVASWPIPMVSAVIPAMPPSCIVSTAVLGTMTIVAFSFSPS